MTRASFAGLAGLVTLVILAGPAGADLAGGPASPPPAPPPVPSGASPGQDKTETGIDETPRSSPEAAHDLFQLLKQAGEKKPAAPN